jgi:peptide/nickel transport system substrate-binding protein
LRTRKTGPPWATLFIAAVFLVTWAGCGLSGRQTEGKTSGSTLQVGFGLASGASVGVRQVAANLALEGLLNLSPEGRPVPMLAESWSVSADRQLVAVRLRPSVTFHDGQPVTSSAVREILLKALPQYLGPAMDDVADIQASDSHTIEISLKRPSAFLAESLWVPISEPGNDSVGTGPFRFQGQIDGVVEMKAYDGYHRGKPSLERILIQPYKSVRAAWADMLRGKIDMLYDVGIDALDSLQPSTNVNVFTFDRPYAYVAILNTRTAALKDPGLRRQLNSAVDRAALVADAFRGHARPAEGPVWPHHWAYDKQLASFRYEPQAIGVGGHRVRFGCIFGDPSLERAGLVLQTQLQAVGVDIDLRLVSQEDLYAKAQSGDFEAILTDAIAGPSLALPYAFWHTDGPFNYGHFSSAAVDAALDSIRHASSDADYKAGVAAFQRAMVDDPPAIFLAWSERARAVSRRFEVPVEPGRDILGTLRLWKLVTSN